VVSDGLPHPAVLAACELLAVEEVYAIGGAQAIAALAYGVPDDDDGGWLVEPVDVIAGPGNIWVAAAKRLVRSVVGIDAEAGPTEIAIIADGGADPAFVAADLISQAEHDPLAASVLITDAPGLAEAVEGELVGRVAATKHRQRVTTALAGDQSAIVLVDDLEQAVAVANAYAAEHLEIITADPAGLAGQIRNAGAIFLGPYSPVPLGDYLAGSNHVLPTGGTARYASGLNVTAFARLVQTINYGPEALAAVADPIIALAEAEDLPAHGAAIAARRPG
jgi:histidinol dehydrogenase